MNMRYYFLKSTFYLVFWPTPACNMSSFKHLKTAYFSYTATLLHICNTKTVHRSAMPHPHMAKFYLLIIASQHLFCNSDHCRQSQLGYDKILMLTNTAFYTVNTGKISYYTTHISIIMHIESGSEHIRWYIYHKSSLLFNSFNYKMYV